MPKLLPGLLLIAALSAVLWFLFRGQTGEARAHELRGHDRVAAARKSRGEAARGHFRRAGLAYPPREIFLRAFKHEQELELWARAAGKPFRLIVTFPVLAASGTPGPKRREGDRQVPEGFYDIAVFNPKSRFHLSLGLNYPNASDRIFADPLKPGGDIYIHGSNVSTGCLALGDDAIKELFLIATDTRDRGQRRIPVHLFPARMDDPEWESFACEHVEQQPALDSFWDSLREGFLAFERERRVPVITVDAGGRYRVAR
ncbi:MAG: L,D-transpeptidase family protein [Verrucomicrobiota bacterium]|nr:L,D-transpeptidase family protein [Verrucomicrobiota bacterium]